MDSPTRSRGRSLEEPFLPPAVPTTTTSLAGTKRPAPSLLPAFEPLSSSPGLPRPVKRHQPAQNAYLKYPTPVPTSSTGILSSSPPRAGVRSQQRLFHRGSPPQPSQRPPLARSASERAPLSAVACVELSENGETLMMGRSSNSSHYQLSTNSLVSRVHVKARYIPPAAAAATAALSSTEDSEYDANGRVEIICNGWNGLKLHCQGRTWELRKGDSFTSETEGTDILVDVQDARVMVQWPKKDTHNSGVLSDSSWDDSPTRRTGSCFAPGAAPLMPSSPLRRTSRIASPASPCPGGGPQSLSSSQRLQDLLPGEDEGGIQIYEDEPELPIQKEGETGVGVDVGASMRTEVTASFHSEVSEQPENENDEDPDEENDPIIHSFGPFGGNLSNRLASILSKSPRFPANVTQVPRSPVKPSQSPRSPSKFTHASSRRLSDLASAQPLPPTSITAASGCSPKKEARSSSLSFAAAPTLKREPSAESLLSSPPAQSQTQSPPAAIVVDPSLRNHIVNQLAFARSSSTPLSTIMQNLPADSKQGLTRDFLRHVMENTPTVGTIERQGKDAAGKPLESEYYYIPEADDDEHRRGLVVDGLRKPSLRACRKQHKQYYWKRPKTP